MTDPHAVDDDPTTPGLTIPSAPLDPDIELSGAPVWALAMLERQQQHHDELRASMEVLADASRSLDRISTDQQLVLGEMRTLSSRVETIERRLGLGERRFEGIEHEIGDLRREIAELRDLRGRLEERLNDLERRAAACEAARGGIDG